MNKLHNDDDQGKHHKVQENYKAVGYKNNRPTAERAHKSRFILFLKEEESKQRWRKLISTEGAISGGKIAICFSCWHIFMTC